MSNDNVQFDETPPTATTRVARDTGLIVLAGLLSKAASLLTVPFLARQLDPTGYGRADLAYGSAVLLIVLVSFSGDIPAAALHARANDDAGRQRILRTYVWTTLAVSTVVAILLLPFATTIATALWTSPGDTDLAIAMLILVPVKCFQGALANIQRLRGRAGLFAALSSIDLLAQLALAVGLVAAGFGPIGVLVGYGAGSLVASIPAAWVGRDVLRGAVQLRPAGGMIRAGLPFVPPIVAFLIADNLGRVFIAHEAGVAAVGDFGIALRAASAMSLVAGAFTLAWGPFGLGLSQTQASSALFGRMFSSYLTMALLVALALGALAPELTLFLGGPQYSGAAPAIPPLLFASGMTGALFVLATAASVHSRTTVVATSATLGAVVQVFLSLLLLPYLGITAVAIAALIGRIVNLGILARDVRDVVETNWRQVAAMTVGGAVLIFTLEQASTWSTSLAPARWAVTIAAMFLVLRMLANVIPIRFSRSLPPNPN